MIIPATIDASTLSHRALAYRPIFAARRISGTSSNGSWRPSTI